MLFKRITGIRFVSFIMSTLLAALLVFAITPMLGESAHATPQDRGASVIDNISLRYNVNLGRLRFNLKSDYTNAPEETIEITNDNAEAVDITGYGFSKHEDKFVVSLDAPTTIGAFGDTSFTIKPADNIAEGTYTLVLAVFFRDSQGNTGDKRVPITLEIISSFTDNINLNGNLDFGKPSVSDIVSGQSRLLMIRNGNPQTVKVTWAEAASSKFSNGQYVEEMTIQPWTYLEIYLEPDKTLTAGTYDETMTLNFTYADGETGTKTATIKLTVVERRIDVDITPKYLDGTEKADFKLPLGYDNQAEKQTFIMTNKNAEDIIITDYSIEQDSDGFVMVDGLTLPATIPGNGSITFTIIPRSGVNEKSGKTTIRFELQDVYEEAIKEFPVNYTIYNPESLFAISPASLDFGTLRRGYSTPEAQTVTVTCTSSYLFQVFRPTSANYEIGEMYWGTTPNVDKSFISSGYPVTFSVRPKTNLPPGSYDEELDLVFKRDGKEVFRKNLPLSFTVEKRDCSITVTSDDHGTASASHAEAKEGETIALSATPENNYQFKEWRIISGDATLGDTTAQSTTCKLGEGDVEVKALFEEVPPGTYGVSVITDGVGNAVANYKSCASGTAVTLSATNAEGYYFDKWEVVSGGVSLANTSNPTTTFTMPSSHVTVKAVFAKNPYNVTITTKGSGSAEATPDSGRQGDSISLTATPGEHFRFKEWQINSGDGTIEDINSANTTFTFGSENAEIKAIFENIAYQVNFTYVGKGNATATPFLSLGWEVLYISFEPEEGYYTRKYEIVGGDATFAWHHETYTYIHCKSESVDVRVTFEAIPYKITYNLNGGSNDSQNPATYTVEDTITLAEPMRDGCGFDGWYDASGNPVTTISKGTTGEITLDAHWHQHDWNDATCTAPKTCKTCGETEGNPTGHYYLWEYVNDANHKGVCDKCGDEIMEEHTYNEEYCGVCNARCKHSSLNDSYSHDLYRHWKTCAYCGTVIEDEEHTWQDEWTADGTQHWYECSVCKRKKDTADHTWDAGKVTKAATTTEAGVKTYTCTVCNATKIEDIPKLDRKANPLKVKGKTATVKYKKLKKKSQTLAIGKVIKFTKKGQGKITYTKASGNKKITINKKTGKVTLKKGLKKGTYKVKVKVKAAGNANYKASAVKTVIFKIKVK